MAQLEILEYPDPRLRLKSAPVRAFDEGLARLVDDLLDTLRARQAIGLSAPQIDDHRAVLVVDLSGDGSAAEVYINPEIQAKAAWGFVEESCLSVPGIVGNVIRATEILVRAHDRQGDIFERNLSGMAAVCLQHEMDHLRGKLFIDRLSIFRRLHLYARTKARRRQERSASREAVALPR